jgi:hypothetical protein
MRIAMTLGPLIALAACTGGPPAFQIDARTATGAVRSSESLSIGHASTPPPGEYRFARLYADGTVDARELFTSNGPGPWLSLTGHGEVPASAVREAFGTAAAPASTPEDPRAPCVLAVDSAASKWQGCAHPTLAARLLAMVPRLTMPDVAANCDLSVCQVRLLRETPPPRHERYGDVRQDRVLDNTGAVWCAVRDAQAGRQIATLRVERVRISEADAPHVLSWVVGVVQSDKPPDRSSPDPDRDRVMVRGRGGEWRQFAESQANGIRARWDQIAARLREECRSTR